jgi:hypothetical protein
MTFRAELAKIRTSRALIGAVGGQWKSVENSGPVHHHSQLTSVRAPVLGVGRTLQASDLRDQMLVYCTT